jgi:hypothetical protein
MHWSINRGIVALEYTPTTASLQTRQASPQRCNLNLCRYGQHPGLHAPNARAILTGMKHLKPTSKPTAKQIRVRVTQECIDVATTPICERPMHTPIPDYGAVCPLGVALNRQYPDTTWWVDGECATVDRNMSNNDLRLRLNNVAAYTLSAPARRFVNDYDTRGKKAVRPSVFVLKAISL